jgi:hypothetical protein
MRAIYRPLSLNRAPVVEMSRRGAELTKYAGNAFLATKITFINESPILREGRRRRQDVARGIALTGGSAKVPARRAGLWRLLLSEGHARAAEDQPGL